MGFAALFFAFFDSAHVEEFLATRLFRRQTFGDVLFGFSLYVFPQFVIKLLVRLSSAK